MTGIEFLVYGLLFLGVSAYLVLLYVIAEPAWRNVRRQIDPENADRRSNEDRA